MKSIKEHQLAGTYRADRHDKKKGKSPGKIPTPPDHLNEEERKIFRDIARKMFKTDSLADLDVYVLEQYSVQMALFRKAKEELQKPGAQYVTNGSKGMSPSPWTVILQKSGDALLRLGGKLGLNPQDRGRVSKVEKEFKNPLFKGGSMLK